jgi:hypothetical protein
MSRTGAYSGIIAATLGLALSACHSSDPSQLGGPLAFVPDGEPNRAVIWITTPEQILRCQDVPYALRRVAHSSQDPIVLVAVGARPPLDDRFIMEFLRRERIPARIVWVDRTDLGRGLWRRLPVLAVVAKGTVEYEADGFGSKVASGLLATLFPERGGGGSSEVQ